MHNPFSVQAIYNPCYLNHYQAAAVFLFTTCYAAGGQIPWRFIPAITVTDVVRIAMGIAVVYRETVRKARQALSYPIYVAGEALFEARDSNLPTADSERAAPGIIVRIGEVDLKKRQCDFVRAGNERAMGRHRMCPNVYMDM